MDPNLDRIFVGLPVELSDDTTGSGSCSVAPCFFRILVVLLVCFRKDKLKASES